MPSTGASKEGLPALVRGGAAQRARGHRRGGHRRGGHRRGGYRRDRRRAHAEDRGTNLFHRGGTDDTDDTDGTDDTDDTDDTRIGASKKDNEAEIGRQVAGMGGELFGRAGAGPRVADEEIAQATLQPVAVAAPQEDGVVGRARHRHGHPR